MGMAGPRKNDTGERESKPLAGVVYGRVCVTINKKSGPCPGMPLNTHSTCDGVSARGLLEEWVLRGRRKE